MTWREKIDKDNDKNKDNDKDKDILRTPPKSNPRDLWHLRHWLQLWQLRIWIHDNLSELTINCDTGQHSQFLQCFLLFLIFLISVRYEVPTQFWNLPPINPMFRVLRTKKPGPNRVKAHNNVCTGDWYIPWLLAWICIWWMTRFDRCKKYQKLSKAQGIILFKKSQW